MSTVPYIPYDNDKKAQEFGNGINQANADYKTAHGTDIPFDPGMISVMTWRACYDFHMSQEAWETTRVKHLNEFRAEYGLDPINQASNSGDGFRGSL